MNQSKNAQNLLSRKWMYIALIKLLRTKELGEITVSELTKTAGVARVTFYRNYTELSEVLFDYLEMSQFGLAEGSDSKRTYLPYFIRNYFEFFQENREMILCLQKNNMFNRLYSALERQLSTNSYIMVSAYGFENPYEISALVGMFVKILMDWLRGGMAESIEDMVLVVYSIITKFSCVSIQ